MDNQSEEFLLLTQAFTKHQVKYLIVGGFAVNRHGYKRTTGDLDIYLQDTPLNRERLVNALQEMGYGRFQELLTMPIIAGYCEIMMDNGVYADLMTEVLGLNPQDFDLHYEMALVDDTEFGKIRYLHYNQLLTSKRATNRNKDLLDIQELEKLNP